MSREETMSDKAIGPEVLAGLFETLKGLFDGRGLEAFDSDDIHISAECDRESGLMRVMLFTNGPQGLNREQPLVKLEVRPDPALLGIANRAHEGV